MTDPLVPPEVDLRDYDYIPLYGDRLFNSDTWALCDADEKVAALRLWWRAWHEEPAGSLPDNDRLLAERAGYGVAVKAFVAIKEKAMRGWIKCSDGRLYHPTVASIAIDVWQTKKKKKAENAADRERKRLKRLAGSPPDNPEIPPDIQAENALKGKGSEDEGKGSSPPSVPIGTSGEGEGARGAPNSLSQEEFVIDDALLAEAAAEREKAKLPKTNLYAERKKYELVGPKPKSRETWLKWAIDARAIGYEEPPAEAPEARKAPPPKPVNPKILGHKLPCGCANCIRWVQENAKAAA